MTEQTNEWLHKQLLDAFAPIALTVIQEGQLMLLHPTWEALGLKPSVYTDSDDKMARVCILKLEFTKSVACSELLAIATQLDLLCLWNDGPASYGQAIEIAGEKWVIGDGDDSGAVMFHHNAFHIWVRHFKYDDDAGDGDVLVEA